MRNIVDVSAFTDPVTLPENGEPVAAEIRDASFQALANRTRNLKDRADGHDVYVGANDASRIVRMGAHEAAIRTGTWEAGDTLATYSALKAKTTGRSSIVFEATAGRALPWKGTVTQVQVQVLPGTIKEAPEAQIRASLYRVEVNPSIVVQVGSTVVCPSNTTDLQLITLPGTVTINGEATSGNNYRLLVVVESGEGLAITNDLVYDARFTITTTVR